MEQSFINIILASSQVIWIINQYNHLLQKKYSWVLCLNVHNTVRFKDVYVGLSEDIDVASLRFIRFNHLNVNE